MLTLLNKFLFLGFEFPHNFLVSPPLNLNLQNDKVPFLGPQNLPKFWGKNQK